MSSPRVGRLGLAGYPGYIFLQKIRYGYGAQRYDEKRIILHNWYSALRAYLPELYHVEDDGETYAKKRKEYTEKLLPLIIEVSNEMENARSPDYYKPSFEDPDTYDPMEAQYEILLEGIKERLDVITAKTHIIDKGQLDDDDGELVAG
jgi:hypothetical protein